MSFTIPNQAGAAYARQAGWYQADIDGLVAALAGDGVLTGLTCTAQASPDMTVAVAAGQARIQGYFPYFAAQNATISAASSSNPRIDLISVDYNGTVTVTAGTAAAAPVCPALPSNSIPLAQVYVQTSASSIGSNAITDKRVAVPDTFDIADEFMGGSVSATVGTGSGSYGNASWCFTAGGTLAAPSFQTSTSAHPGVLRTSTGTTSGNATRMCYGSAATTAMVSPANISRLRYLVAIPTITTLAIKVGLGQDTSVATANQFGTAGAWVEFVPATSAKWSFNTRQGGTSTTNTDTGADVASATWYQFDIVRLQNGNWQFAKNGALAFTHSTNLPTTICNLGTLTHTLTTAARNLDHDFIGINFAPLGNRWT